MRDSDDHLRPQIIYDDDCGFCTRFVDFAVRRGEFEVLGFSELTEDHRTRLPDEYRNCVHFVVGDRVYSCGAATEEILARLDAPVAVAARAFRLVPGRDPVRERLYRLVADNRSAFGRLLG